MGVGIGNDRREAALSDSGRLGVGFEQIPSSSQSAQNDTALKLPASAVVGISMKLLEYGVKQRIQNPPKRLSLKDFSAPAHAPEIVVGLASIATIIGSLFCSVHGGTIHNPSWVIGGLLGAYVGLRLFSIACDISELNAPVRREREELRRELGLPDDCRALGGVFDAANSAVDALVSQDAASLTKSPQVRE